MRVTTKSQSAAIDCCRVKFFSLSLPTSHLRADFSLEGKSEQNRTISDKVSLLERRERDNRSSDGKVDRRNYLKDRIDLDLSCRKIHLFLVSLNVRTHTPDRSRRCTALFSLNQQTPAKFECRFVLGLKINDRPVH